MLYRTMGSTGVDVSALGFGCMRLPLLDGNAAHIDEEKAAAMLHHAIDEGVNYVDTAWFYHAEQFGQPGASEPFVGRALAGGWRDRVNLATKLPQQLITQRGEMDRYLEQQLERLQTDHIDFYLVHSLTGEAWDKVHALGVEEFLDAARADGRIRHAGFSFHGQKPDFPRIIDAYNWDFAQIQFNYIDVDYQAGYSGLRYAADKGLGLIVMEPLKGGKLAGGLPPEAMAAFERTGVQRTPAEWALRYVLNERGVSLTLSGMGAMEQVEENIRVASEAEAGSLTSAELAAYDEAREIVTSRTRAACTACAYCQPCPMGVEIPRVLASLNTAFMWGDSNQWNAGYTQVKGVASLCSECGQCEEICPQALPIRELMKEAAETFGR